MWMEELDVDGIGRGWNWTWIQDPRCKMQDAGASFKVNVGIEFARLCYKNGRVFAYSYFNVFWLP